MNDLKQKALNYHCMDNKPGKLTVEATKPCDTAAELSLAYSPGVAHPVLEIADHPEDAYRYTGKGNLVAVITNGTAILGLGDRGALASKPVMEGKGVLFKRFADIDVFDIELDTRDPKKIIETVKLLQPTFGGVNLEDIKAPECFEIEQTLIEECNIPVFHDDQHGTAIICTAGMMNAAELTGRKLENMKMVISGAGAAGISCAKMFVAAGIRHENLFMCDVHGVLYRGRDHITPEMEEFCRDTDKRTLREVMAGADAFLGVSAGNLVDQDMVKSMADEPILFAMANPTPEIMPSVAREARPDCIIGTGRSDYPNQINNVLGFPFIFRGALDVRARKISEGMKVAAANALAQLAKEPVPEVVRKAYEGQEFSFGKDYIVPKPFDPRVIEWESVAVAKAACEEGLAQKPIEDWDVYRVELKKRMERFWK